MRWRPGGLAAAVAGHIRDFWDQQPTIVVVEPEAAPCLMESNRARQLTRVEGPSSNMGRLDCKDTSLIAFQSLKNDANLFVSISDEDVKQAASLRAVHNIPTTASGAASFAALAQMKSVAAGIDLDNESRCLVFVTEGPEVG